jgi:hypothetical protein
VAIMTDSVSVSSLQRPIVHRYAVVAAVCGLAAVVSGAIVTGSAVTDAGGPALVRYHEIISSLAAVVIATLGIWMVAKHAPRLGWYLLAVLLTEGGLGSFQRSPGLEVLHACLGQILFAMTVAAVVSTGAGWSKEPEIVEDHGWPSLGGLGRITPVFVLGQIALGAAFRHKALGVMPHLGGAILIVMLVLCICIFVMQQFPEHSSLRPSANLLMALAFTQIFLGIAAFTVRTMSMLAASAVIGVTSTHAAVGAMVLAASVVLQMQIRRHVRPHREEEETAGASGIANG